MSDAFADSRAYFDTVIAFLDSPGTSGLDHAQLEDRLRDHSRELFRRLFQDHLDQRAAAETRLRAVTDADGVVRGCVEADHHRGLATIFGVVDVTRLAYRSRGFANLHVADALLNLPAEHYSHGLRRLAAIEAARGSFDATVTAIERNTGTAVPKRQVEELTRRAAGDVDRFYSHRPRLPTGPGDVIVISVDGKGVVMRADALRPATRRAAATSSTKLTARLSKGEKRNRKRMAEIGAVYEITPVPRLSAQIFASADNPPTPGPAAKNKWVTASIVEDAADVVAAVFDDADRRDPTHLRAWIALVDGNNHQIDSITTEATQRGVKVTILIDVIHVIEYLWAAAWCFFAEADPDAQQWVQDRATAVLEGKAVDVAAGIRRRATTTGLPDTKRAKADDCARYLTNKAAYLHYPTALTAGWPIATGVIEGACRHIVKDRLDITGARWGLDGAEAILKLRTVYTNGDFDEYWADHLEQEQHRVHETRYLNGQIPHAA